MSDNLRDRNSQRYHETKVPDEFRKFFDKSVWPLLQKHLGGYKMEEKKELAMQFANCLVTTGLIGACVADSRNTHETGVSLRVTVWDAFVKAQLADVWIGNEMAGKTSRYGATVKLLDLRRQWKLPQLVDTRLARNTATTVPETLALVVLTSGKFNPATGMPLEEELQKQPVCIASYIRRHAQPGPDGKPAPQAIENGMEYVRKIEDEIDRINRNNLIYNFIVEIPSPVTGKLRACPINPCLRQVHSGSLFRAARLYSWSVLSGQNLPKKVRRTMRIDGDNVVELDFSAMAIRLLYHKCRIDPDVKADLYRPEEVFTKYPDMKPARQATVRDFVKRSTNICLNVDSKPAANSAVGKLLAEHAKADKLRKVMDAAGLNVCGVVDRVIAAHPDVSQHFFTDMGCELMTLDGKIMKRILLRFADEGKPALALHDAIVCRQGDADFTKKTMRRCYREMMGFKPVIHREF